MKQKYAIYGSTGKISKEFINFEDFFSYILSLKSNKSVEHKIITENSQSNKKPLYILRKKSQKQD